MVLEPAKNGHNKTIASYVTPICNSNENQEIYAKKVEDTHMWSVPLNAELIVSRVMSLYLLKEKKHSELLCHIEGC